MLYIFHVDTGTTITFDIKLALQSVAQLKEAIERECGVVASQQVLLMSGGESLEPTARVCSYSAGTDTNPIYLFSKAAIESHLPPTPSLDYGSDVDLHSQIEVSLTMPATYHTVVARAQLAQQCCGLARELTRICEKLVHDQHLQQQGWAAVVANLEDITQVFQTKADFLQHTFSQYLIDRQQHMELLQNFSSDLGTLAKIPILPALRAQAEGFLDPEEVSDKSEDASMTLSLLKWISAKDNQSSLEQVAEQCSKGLEQFDERVLESLKAEVNAAIENANNQTMKEIKGLGERLFALEELMTQARRLVQEQGELAQGFLQNQNRANNLGDASVLPDLCMSHRRQLMVMLKNHNQLRDIRKKCTRAKEELSVNINQRLKWIMYVENKIMEVDGKLIIYNENLRRLRRHMEVLQQIHLAPEMYMSAIAEVVRRKTFSQAFMVWASDLACELLTVHNEELARRREFQNKFEGHFLNTLFPGLEDTPPPFATQAPSVFDNSLPKLTIEDMETIKQQLPELSLNMSTPDLNSITQFFLSKSLSEVSNMKKGKDKSSILNNTKDKVQEGKRALMGERTNFGSETDTEEFEKICQDAGDSKISDFENAKQRQKQLEENLVNTRDEVERLRSTLRTMKTVTCDTLLNFRKEMMALRERSILDKQALAEMSDRIGQTVSLALRIREQELTMNHEMKLNEAKEVIEEREKEINSMKEELLEKDFKLSEQERFLNTLLVKFENKEMEMRNLDLARDKQLEEALRLARIEHEAEITSLSKKLKQCQERISELEENLAMSKATHEQVLKETTDKLQMEHKMELQTMRSRFKLMAASTTEQSPSDSSLEKIERADVIELANHDAVMAQTEEDIKLEKAASVKGAIKKERADFESKEAEKLPVVKQMRKMSSTEVDLLQARKIALCEECEMRLKDTIGCTSESENEFCQSIIEKIKSLEADKRRLYGRLSADRKMLEKQHNQIHDLEAERNELRQELNDERLKMSQGDIDDSLKSLKDEVTVSESKKVRLDADVDSSCNARRLEHLENENNRLTAELRLITEKTEAMEAKVVCLKADKVRLEMELVKERRRVFGILNSPSVSSSSESREKEMNTSIAVVGETSQRDRSTSPKTTLEDVANPTSSRPSPVVRNLMTGSSDVPHQGRISTTSCKRGDIVLVLWNTQHMCYILLQESSTFYFLNSDCIEALDLEVTSEGTPNKTHVFAEVVGKEYCHARKTENRYRVPKGTKFYRVRVKPIQSVVETPFLPD